MREGRKKEASKGKQTNKAKQHSTPIHVHDIQNFAYTHRSVFLIKDIPSSDTLPLDITSGPKTHSRASIMATRPTLPGTRQCRFLSKTALGGFSWWRVGDGGGLRGGTGGGVVAQLGPGRLGGEK